MQRAPLLSGLVLSAAIAMFPQQEQKPIELSVDLTEAPRRLIHARVIIPVKPGTHTLQYPKWIPGEHGPTGPVADLVNLRITGGGKALVWRRDPVDMYAVHCEVPTGVSSIEMAYTYVAPANGEGFSGGASNTAQLAVLSWNQVLLYPKSDQAADNVMVKARLKVPPGWRWGTALRVASESGDVVEFEPASLTTMVDSPVLAGRHFRSEDLSPGSKLQHYLHAAADSAGALEWKPELTEAYRRLAAETGAMFGSRPYGRYHFLLTLSDHVAHFGLEHHESSDNRIPEFAMVDEDARRLSAGLLPHEVVHSWNGKFRRPAGLATKDYQQPMEGELLWVYEGLTTYLGDILTPRSGLLTADEFRQELALTAAAMDHRAGREWRPLADTTVGAQLLYGSRQDWANLRRGVDFYSEGELIWLEADTIIRRLSQGRRTLDDFCRRFHGGPQGAPAVKPFTYEEVVADLAAVQPYDWKAFFDERVYRAAPRAPLGGIENAGWRLVYREQIPEMLRIREGERKSVELSYSLGVSLKEDGTITDVIAGLPADKAGLAPAMKIIAVDGRQFSPKLIRRVIGEYKTREGAMELLAKDGEYYKVYKLGYHAGERYPHLERNESMPDLLSEIIAPQAGR